MSGARKVKEGAKTEPEGQKTCGGWGVEEGEGGSRSCLFPGPSLAPEEMLKCEACLGLPSPRGLGLGSTSPPLPSPFLCPCV